METIFRATIFNCRVSPDFFLAGAPPALPPQFSQEHHRHFHRNSCRSATSTSTAILAGAPPALPPQFLQEHHRHFHRNSCRSTTGTSTAIGQIALLPQSVATADNQADHHPALV